MAIFEFHLEPSVVADYIGRLEAVEEAAHEYRSLIKQIAPTIQISVDDRRKLEPIIEAARKLDAALNEV